MAENAQDFEARARARHDEQKWEQATELWQECLNFFPSHPRVPIWKEMRANARLEGNHLEEATAYYFDLTNEYPDRPTGYTGLARVAARKGDWEAAVGFWERCLELFPTRREFWWLLSSANALLETGRYKDSEARFALLAEQNRERPDGYVGLARVAQKEQNWLTAAERWMGCAEKFPGHADRDRWVARSGLALLNAGRELEAETRFRDLLDKSDSHLGADGLAKIAQLRRDWEEVVAQCERCLTLAPESSEKGRWFGMRGYALIRLRRFDEAENSFRAQIDLSPGSHEGFEGLAWAAEEQHQWASAINYWDRCFDFGNQAARKRACTRKAYCFLEIGQVDKAREIFLGLADNYPDDPAGALGIARIASAQGPIALARDLWEGLVDRFPDLLEAQLGKAEHLLETDCLEEADVVLRETQERWPESSSASALWGRCATALKQWDRSNTFWTEVLERHPRDMQTCVSYSAYLAAFGDSVRAEEFFSSLPNELVRSECRLEYHSTQEDLGRALDDARAVVQLGPENTYKRLKLVDLLMRQGDPDNLKSAVEIARALHLQYPKWVIVIVCLAQTLIRASFDGEAIETIATIPSDEKRAEVQILRAWAEYGRGDRAAASNIWRQILSVRYIRSVHAPIGTLERVDSHSAAGREGEIIVFSVFRNEMPRLAWFLDYYRKLGADRFVMIDNASTDGGAEFLLKNDDVIFYHTPDRFDRSGFGMRWINELVSRHGSAAWCLHVDADEALVFPGCEEEGGLEVLTTYMHANNHEALFAPMLDMFPATVAEVAETTSYTECVRAFRFFDNDLLTYGSPHCPYKETLGGIRRRLFGSYSIMNKVPLIWGGSGIKFLLCGHRITPARLSDVTGALLHYHLIYALADRYHDLFQRTIDEKEHSSAGSERIRLIHARKSTRLETNLQGPRAALLTKTYYGGV